MRASPSPAHFSWTLLRRRCDARLRFGAPNSVDNQSRRLVPSSFTVQRGAMRQTSNQEPVPLDEVAAVLADAALRIGGGPAALITAGAQQLVAALDAAGLRVVRATPPGPQLTL